MMSLSSVEKGANCGKISDATAEAAAKPKMSKKASEKCKSRLLVCLYWIGYPAAATHRRRPATAPRGRFELLGHPPGPVRTSLVHLDIPDSSEMPIWTQGLARTPVRHEPR